MIWFVIDQGSIGYKLLDWRSIDNRCDNVVRNPEQKNPAMIDRRNWRQLLPVGF